MIDIKMYRAQGTASGGAPASSIEVMNWNMKDDASYTVAYYPTNEGIGQAPLIRPTVAGDQRISFPVYTYFAITGIYNTIKNIRFEVSVDTAPQADNSQLFFKMTNVYATPTADFDGDMILLANNGTLLETKIYPMLSSTGPTSATTRQKSYTNPSGSTTLYTNFFVTQTRVNYGSSIGNTPEFRLRLRADEYGPF